MRRVNEITIDADLQTIYALAANVEQWPALLPHYRAVELRWLETGGRRLVARMRASRDGIPVTWTCWLERDPIEPRLTFRHIGGFTRGMRVAWTFEQIPDGRVLVQITHEFRKGWPIRRLDRFVSEALVGTFFVHAIATRTLGMVKLLAESAQVVAVCAQLEVEQEQATATGANAT